jgi:hypothetical protein
MDNAVADSVISLKSLRWSLALLLLASLLAATAIAAVLHLGDQARQSHQQALVQQAETRARLARAHDDAREIRGRITRYLELIAQGRTQPERRLEWVETLRGIKDARRLLGLDYEISPQRPLDEKMPASGGFDFLASPMKLEMPLLHENDLLGLLADLQAQVGALISVRRCRIERIPVNPAQPMASLKATCEIDWITLQEKT